MFAMNLIEKSVSLRLTILAILLLLLQPFPIDWRDKEDFRLAREASQSGHQFFQIKQLQSIFQRHPWRGDLIGYLGEISFLQGDKNKALDYLLEANQKEKITREGRAILLSLLLENGLPQANKVTILQIINSAECSDLSNILSKWTTPSFGDWIEITKSWVERCPNDPDALFQWGLYRLIDNIPEGLKYLKTAAKIEPKYRSVLSEIEEFHALILSEKNSAYHLTILGRTFMRLEKYELAQEVFKKAVQIQPDYSEAWAFLGETKLQLGDVTGKEDLEKAIRLNPQSVVSRALHSHQLAREHDYDQAIREMELVTQIDPQQSIWVIELGRLNALAGDLFKAYSYYDKAISMDPNNPLVWKNMAQFCVTYDFDVSGRGLSSAREALRLSPEDAESQKIMGDILYHLGDWASAERFWVVALHLNPVYGEVYFSLGQLYLQQNRMEESLKMLEKARTYSSQDDIKNLATRLIERYFP